MYARLRLKYLAAEDASFAPDTSILIQQTTNVRHVRSDMCKMPPTGITPPASLVMTVKDEQAHKLHAQTVSTDNLAAETAFADDAPLIKYQTAGKPVALHAVEAEKQTATAFSVYAQADKWVR